MSAQNIVDQLKTYQEDGDGLLKRLLAFKTIMKDPNLRPKIFEKQLEKTISKTISKFPEIVPPEKISGFDSLTACAKATLDELSCPYFALADSYDWTQKVKKALADASQNIAAVSLKETPATMTNILNLVELFGKVAIFVSRLPAFEKKATLMVYSRMHFYQTKSEEPLFKDTARWVHADDPFGFIAESLAPCSKVISQCLRDVTLTIADISNTDKLRQDYVLSVLGKANEIQVITDDLLRFELLNAERVRIWTFYASLAYPLCLRQDETLFSSSLGFLLRENLVAHLDGGESWNLQEVYEKLWDSAKTKDKKVAKTTSKEKRAIRESSHICVTEGWEIHSQRRLFLTQALHELVAIAEDSPAIIPFKLNLMLAALAMAREEIFWYFRNLPVAPALLPKKDHWKDVRITELIYYQRTLEDTIFNQSDNISHFFAQMLVVADTAAAAEAARELGGAGGDASVIANEMAGILSGFGGDAEAVFENDFELIDKFHNLYDALDYAMAVNPQASKFTNALVTMHAIARHAEFVYALDFVLDRNSSLLNLWYYNTPVREAFLAHLSGERADVGAPYAATYLLLLCDYPRNTNQFWPEEREYMGKACTEEAQSFCTAMAERVHEHLKTILKYNQVHVGQFSVKHALSIYQSELPTFKPPKDFQPPVRPGTESQFDQRQAMRPLRLAMRDMGQIIHSLSELDTLIVFDCRIVPLEYIREVVQVVLRNWLRSMLRPNGNGSIRRPSAIAARFETVFHSLASVEHFATLGLEAAWREVIISEIYIPDFCTFGSSCPTPLKLPDRSESTLSGLLDWYENFITKSIPNSAGNIVYSPICRTFVTRRDAPAQLNLGMADSMLSVSELRALASIIGPYGVKVFDSLLLWHIVSLTNIMKDHIMLNAAVLDELAKSYSVESRFIENAKKLKDMDRFVTNAIQIGVLLTFRSMLKDALHDVMCDTVPYIASSIESTFNAYPRNMHIEPGLLSLDLLASDYGVDVGPADQALKTALKTALKDGDDPSKSWKLLPVMFGVMFLSPTWREAHFIPSMDAYQGNLHLLSRVINDYICHFTSLFINPPDDKQVQLFMAQFVDIACMTLLRQQKIPIKGEKKPDWAAIMIFIDHFVDACPHISHDVLEQSIPYTLIRSLTRDIYATRPTDGW